MSRRIVLALSVVLIVTLSLLIITACMGESGRVSVTDNGYEASTIRLQYGTAYMSAVPQLLMLTEILEEMLPDDVSVEFINIQASPDARDALVSNNLDIALLPMPTFIAAIENDLPLVMLSTTVVQSCIVFGVEPNIRSMDDLNAQSKIALISKGGAFHLALMLETLFRYGDAERFENNIIPMQSVDQLASVQSSFNELDAITIGFPLIATASDIDTLNVIADLTPVMVDNDLSSFMVTSNTFSERNPFLVQIINEAIREIKTLMIEKPAEAAMILSDYYDNVSVEDVEIQIRSAPPRYEISESAYNRVAELMYEVGIIPNPPKPFSSLPNYDSIPKVP